MAEPTQIKALSFYQPYAWLIANGFIEVDDRTWKTNYRGLLAIHASKKLDLKHYEYVKNELNIKIPDVNNLEYGGIIAVCKLESVINTANTTIDKSKITHHGILPYGLVLKNPIKTPFISLRGQPGLFDIQQIKIIEDLNKIYQSQ